MGKSEMAMKGVHRSNPGNKAWNRRIELINRYNKVGGANENSEIKMSSIEWSKDSKS